jgi:hypothetical protein
MKCRHLSEVPAIRWKLENLGELKKSNLRKFVQQANDIRGGFENRAN